MAKQQKKSEKAASGETKTAAGVLQDNTFKKVLENAAGKKIVLHIGCGHPNPAKLHKSFPREQWYELRVDIDPDAKPEIVSDMTDMYMIPDGSVDAVWSSHNLEHLYPHTVPVALEEFFRVIKTGGHLLITMPDIQTACAYVASGNLEEALYDSPAGPICAIDIMYGHRTSMARGNLFMAHRTAFTAQTLGNKLRDAGFSNIHVSRVWLDLWSKAMKYPLNHPDRVEKIIIQEPQDGKIKPIDPPPLQQQRHPGFMGDKARSDELNVPPKIWKPLNLGLKK